MNTIITTDSGMNPININTMIPGQIIENDLVCYKDVFEISSKKIIEKLNKGYNFKTSSPLPVDYYSMFERYINKYKGYELKNKIYAYCAQKGYRSESITELLSEVSLDEQED